MIPAALYILLPMYNITTFLSSQVIFKATKNVYFPLYFSEPSKMFYV